MSGMSAPEAGAGCHCRRGRELCEALISQSHGEGPVDLTLAWTLRPFSRFPFQWRPRCIPSPRGGGSGTSRNLRKGETLAGALRCYRLWWGMESLGEAGVNKLGSR